MKRSAAVMLGAVLALAGCSAAPAPSATSTPTPEAGYDWTGYPDETRLAVERSIELGDCELLQGAFNLADLRGDLDLMRYLDSQLKSAGCYS